LITGNTTYKANDFSQQYYLLRKKEGRIYSDEEVEKLPEITIGHQYFSEWQIRKRSFKRLLKYLQRKTDPLEILEVGCGNGWLSARLSVIPLSNVTGIDINTEELEQAKQVFSGIKNIDLFNCSINDKIIRDRRFDIIVFAASIQYFRSLTSVLNDAITYLKPGGEIHIVDSHFYDEKEIDAAKQRSNDYYNSIGFPGMADQYFHHSLNEIRSFQYNILFDPNSFINKLKGHTDPFYWICIKANA
jgi:ubiquinone/menaquinone biosynthesis C-methylase UbiE